MDLRIAAVKSPDMKGRVRCTRGGSARSLCDLSRPGSHHYTVKTCCMRSKSPSRCELRFISFWWIMPLSALVSYFTPFVIPILSIDQGKFQCVYLNGGSKQDCDTLHLPSGGKIFPISTKSLSLQI